MPTWRYKIQGVKSSPNHRKCGKKCCEVWVATFRAETLTYYYYYILCVRSAQNLTAGRPKLGEDYSPPSHVSFRRNFCSPDTLLKRSLLASLHQPSSLFKLPASTSQDSLNCCLSPSHTYYQQLLSSLDQKHPSPFFLQLVHCSQCVDTRRP